MMKKGHNTFNEICEYCDGKVIERQVKREMFRVKENFIILENIPVGVCNRCGTRYYHAKVVRRAHQIARHEAVADYKEAIPVGHLI